MGKRPVMSIVRQSGTGHATNVIGGLAVGMESTFLPILVLAGGIWGSYSFAGLYGVSIAAAGMMATTAMQLAIDAFGPIADNAGGIAEMSELPPDVREKTDVLDAVGNTTAASGKGFAIASAALTALALFAAFVGVAGIEGIDIYKANVLACLFVGGMIPFIFSSLAIRAVGEAAMAMVEEVRRQFRTIPGIMEGTGKPEYEKCVAISTEASLKKMVLPGAIAIVSPLIIGFMPGLGAEALGGFLAGATVSGVLMGMFQNNAGGAWDNAKKSFEKGVEINGEVFYKKSEPHKASVTGDTVGDPFKDTSGPSMNILIKLMSIVSLVIAPTLAQISGTGHSAHTPGQPIEIEQKVIVEGGAKQNSNEVQVAIDAIKSAGLVKEGESYKIDFKDGVLKINDVVVPQSTLDSLSFNKDIMFEVEMDVNKKQDGAKGEKEVKIEVKVDNK
jgi:K(+)-stimulated pyrophosphate-energized sodium pump